MRRYVIAVDGPAGSGKSTVCRQVAASRGISYVDSGALYRAVTLHILKTTGTDDVVDYTTVCSSLKLKQTFNEDNSVSTYLNDVDVSSEIRTEEVVSHINKVSSIQEVRDFITNQLRLWSASESLIMDGRDIGSVVFPDADIKIYLDASVDVRASRRYEEYIASGKNVDLKSIKNQIIQRDNQDRLREYGALVECDDAEHLDTSHLNINQAVERINQITDNKLKLSDGKSGKMMENVDDIFEDNVSMDELMGESIDPSSGEVINGEVVSADNDFVYVNVGGKTEGRVQASEFDTPPTVGQTVNVFVTKKRSVEGMYQLSHRLAETIVQWEKFREWYTEDTTTVKGKIVSIKQNGAIVDFGVFKGFIPKNLAADIRFKDAVNTDDEYDFKIVKVDDRKKSVILSRRDYLDEIKMVAWERITQEYKEGDTITGTVTRLVEFGAFVDLGGFEALLHKNDISWRKVYTRKDYIKKGDTKEFKILGINEEEKKISLGLKQMREDPWTGAADRYIIGQEYDGLVSGTTNFGVFVELEEGVEGLVPAEEMVWAKKAPNPKNLYKKGEDIKVKVLAINPEEKTVSLSIKQTQENPWHSLKDRFPVGSISQGVIKNIVEYGMFVELEDKVDAFIHISDITWDDSVKKPLEQYKEGDSVEFKIMSINVAEMKVSASIKNLTKSPWDELKERYPVRTRIKGEITSIKQFGLFVKIEENVEGLIHISEISRKKVDNLEEMFNVGDVIECVVLDIDAKKKKISLSKKSLEVQAEKDDVKKILGAQSQSTASIGDMLKLKGDMTDDE